MRSKGCKRKKQGKFKKIVCLLIRILSNARELYIKSMVTCAGRIGNGGRVVCHTPPEALRLPKSFSVSSSTADDGEEFRQLLRTTSKHGIDSKVDQKIQQQQQQQERSGVNQRTMGLSAGRTMGMRSYSVGVGKIGRIDEDEPCSFVEDETNAMRDLMYPRTRCRGVGRNLIVYR